MLPSRAAAPPCSSMGPTSASRTTFSELDHGFQTRNAKILGQVRLAWQTVSSRPPKKVRSGQQKVGPRGQEPLLVTVLLLFIYHLSLRPCVTDVPVQGQDTGRFNDLKDTVSLCHCVTAIHVQERGAGYWLWKPYIILKTLLYEMEEGDLLLYADSGSEAIGDLRPLFELAEEDDIVIFRNPPQMDPPREAVDEAGRIRHHGVPRRRMRSQAPGARLGPFVALHALEEVLVSHDNHM